MCGPNHVLVFDRAKAAPMSEIDMRKIGDHGFSIADLSSRLTERDGERRRGLSVRSFAP
jgi:hypothetical protein